MEYSADDTTKGLEYETQFFGFTPKSFVDGVYNAISDYVTECCLELEKALKNEPSLCGQDITPELLHKSTDDMLSAFYDKLDNTFDRFELFMEAAVFIIPKNALLPGDEVHRGKNYTQEEEKQVDKDIQEFLRKIKAAKYVNTALKQEIKELDVMESYMADCEKHCDTLAKTCNTALGLKESLEFTHDQAKQLHSLLETSLENKSLPLPSPKKDSTAIERKKIKIG